ncbi:class I SAM-dependent methyltransferase [Corallincola platygyrae]|uniref:Class I SAM-dependent methyltransferase n=1 Tax=Corallincola platygyrae TaxID=1193278 RepID=A0ABW4XIS5_9GAMM
MNTTAKFWNGIAARYAKKPIGDEAAYEKKLEITRQYFEPHMQLLELGCGTGSTALLHAPYVKHIRAVDISSEMLAIAKQKAQQQGIENVSFEQASIDQFETQQQFDMVLTLSVLHLMDDKDAVIKKIAQRLKSGGLFVSSTVCLGTSMRWLKLIWPLGRALGLFPPTLKHFTPEQLTQSVIDAGFTIEHLWRPNDGRTAFIVARKE